MSREIKFAFWHNQKKEMWSVESINWRLKEVCNGGDVANLNDGVLLEYTGFVDINGIKIFENNIVHISGIGNYVINDIRKDFDMLVNAIVEGDLNEIVGNIYEHKELITGVKNG